MKKIEWTDFEAVDLRVGTVIMVEDFPEANKSAYKLTVDFGALGIKKSSAQITKRYSKERLLGKQLVGVVNFPPKQIGKFMSEFLVTGFADQNGDIILTTVDANLPNGSKMI
ncbi:tRNA-binding protein [Pedobacter sp. UYP30]|uniref:tRNA-binding protein n=1 Tax=Pedobacter sp. UYP30 TaxID=1756400 RepID=UPI0033986801